MKKIVKPVLSMLLVLLLLLPFHSMPVAAEEHDHIEEDIILETEIPPPNTEDEGPPAATEDPPSDSQLTEPTEPDALQEQPQPDSTALESEKQAQYDSYFAETQIFEDEL